MAPMGTDQKADSDGNPPLQPEKNELSSVGAPSVTGDKLKEAPREPVVEAQPTAVEDPSAAPVDHSKPTGRSVGRDEEVAASASSEVGTSEEMAVYITVYPPPQSGATPLVLEPLAGVELVMQVRQLLAEIPQTCIYSAFQLVAVTPEVESAGTKREEGQDGKGGAASGGKRDVMTAAGDVMNDYAELKSIPAVAARPEKVEVRMELEPYNAHTARQHVNKFRDLLRYPPPCPDGFGPAAAKSSGNGSKKGKGSKGAGGSGKSKKVKEGSGAGTGAAAAAAGTGGSAQASAPVRTTAAAPSPGSEPTGGGSGSSAGAADGVAGVAEEASAPASILDKLGGDLSPEDMAQRVQRAMEIRSRLKDCRVAVGSQGLAGFYGVGLGLALDEVAFPPAKEKEGGAGNGNRGGSGGSGGGGGNSKGGDKDADSPVVCLRGVSISAWNPPPPQRKMVGDLLYIEVTALDGMVIHVTCTQWGFYVNGTRRDSFDPTPNANNPSHSHELATCLLSYSPSFARAWNNAVIQAWKRSQADDPVHALARAMREGRGDAVMVKPQWNCPLPEARWGGHKADPSRAQEDLTSGFGVDDRGVPREWNDEYQCLLELPNDTPELSMTRSRALYKLLCDFQEAATAGALAIADGHIPSANPTEAEHSHVFVFNNIFFSYAADSPDAYKAISGQAAARKSASQDLANVVALNSLAEAFHPQLKIKTLATAVVDFAGRRMIAQSLVPGILNGDQTNKVVYGAMEHGQALRPNEEISALLRQVGQRLMIAEREVEAVPIKTPPGSTALQEDGKPGSDVSNGNGVVSGSAKEAEEEHKSVNGAHPPSVEASSGTGDEGKATTGTVVVTGAVEMKGIVGSDNRSYLLDVARLTPRDANWVRGKKGTGVYDDWLKARSEHPRECGDWERDYRGGDRETRADAAEDADMSFEHMAVLRPELLTMFTRHKVAEWFRERDGRLASVRKEGAVGNGGNTAAEVPAVAASSAEVPAAQNSETDATSSATAGTAAEGSENAYEKALETQVSPTNGSAVNAIAEGPETKEMFSGDSVPVPAAGDSGGEGVAMVAGGGAGKEASSGGEEGKEGEAGGEPVSALRLSEDEVAKLKEEQEARCRELAMNVNVFMPYKGCVDPVQLEADEALAREAARYLWDESLPFVTSEVKRGSLCPIDCAELAPALHTAGVNLRYMGKLADMAIAEETEDAAVRAEGKLRRWRMPLFWLEMLETEMAARAATHVFNRYMSACAETLRTAPGVAVQRFLNCMVGGAFKARDMKSTHTSNGTVSAPTTSSWSSGNGNAGSASSGGASHATATAEGAGAGVGAEDSTWINPQDGGGIVRITREGLWASIVSEVAARFRHIPVIWGRHYEDIKVAHRAHRIPLLRRVCQRLGIRVLSRSYDFNRVEPFVLEDIVSTFPVVKVLAVLQILGRGNCYHDVCQMSYMSESAVCQTFHTFCRLFAEELYDEYIRLPVGPEHERVMEHYHRVGFTGAVGSTDVTHVRWDSCPFSMQRSYTGKEGYPTLAYQATVDHTGRVLGVTPGFAGAQNDKTIARFDPTIEQVRDNPLYRDKEFSLRRKDGSLLTVKGNYLIVDNGYHKSCVPSSPVPDAVEALEMAQLHLGPGGGLQTAHDLAQHAATMLLQACDGMHTKYPAALTLQARVMYHTGDADAAVAYQLKALAYFEQLEGLDSSQVIKSHEHLGQYYMLAGLYDRALAHMRAFCYLLEMTSGPHHPELASGYHRMGRAYQEVGSVMMALRCYQEALERQVGDHMINPRIHHNVAETLESIGGFTDALKHERLSHAGYKAVHGEEHPLVITSTQNIRALTTKIVKAAQGEQQQALSKTPLRNGSCASSSSSGCASRSKTGSSPCCAPVGTPSSGQDAAPASEPPAGRKAGGEPKALDRQEREGTRLSGGRDGDKKQGNPHAVEPKTVGDVGRDLDKKTNAGAGGAGGDRAGSGGVSGGAGSAPNGSSGRSSKKKGRK